MIGFKLQEPARANQRSVQKYLTRSTGPRNRVVPDIYVRFVVSDIVANLFVTLRDDL